MKELRQRIREVLEHIGTTASFEDTQDVFATCVVTSLNLLELICCLEDKFGVVVSQRDVFEGSLRSVDRIVELVEARQS